MTKKHFEALAKELATVRPSENEKDRYSTWTECVVSVAKICRKSNNNFMWDHFIESCKSQKSYAYVK